MKIRTPSWFVVVALVVTFAFTPLLSAGPAAAKLGGYCTASQMRVNLSFNKLVHSTATLTWTGQVRYRNFGATCTMSRSDVGVQAVIGAAHTPIGQGSISDAVARLAFVMAHNSSAVGSVSVILMYPKYPKSCVPVAINTIEITGYEYGWPSKYFNVSHQLGICPGVRVASVGGVLTPVGPLIPALGVARVRVITGPIEECGAGRADNVVRAFVVSLHQRPSGRVLARYTVEPQKAPGWYAFYVALGTYFLTTNEDTSPPPKGNIVITATSKSVTMVPIATKCQ